MRRDVGSIGARTRSLGVLAVFITLVVLGNLLAREIANALDFEIRPSNEDLVHRVLMVSAAAYSVLLAIPFVPSVEIGMALMAIFGPPVAILLYASTVAGLSVAFLAGRLIPVRTLIALLDGLHLLRARDLLTRLEAMDASARVAFVLQRSSNRIVPTLVRHRYLALALVLNVPGNLLIGGGGGIAMACGLSRLYSVGGFIATIAIAVVPLPLAVLVFGEAILGR